MGRKNPNSKYNINDDFFKEIKSEDKAYLLGWIASDGHVNKSGVYIKIHEKDVNILEILRNIICEELLINPTDGFVDLSINSNTIATDVCKHLNINFGKKSDTVCFPELESDDLKWAFLRGFFDGDGCVHTISETHSTPSCSITTNSESMRNYIKSFVKIPCGIYGSSIEWYGNNALDFLSKIYDNSNYKLIRKYDLYLDICTWAPSVSYSRFFKNNHCSWSKTRKDAVAPFKERASDSGYDLTLLEKIKTYGDVEFYDTGIKIKPIFGYYFIMVPRSSISKSGYILANSIGIIDRTYLGNIIVPLIKIDKNAPDLQLPIRLVQIIPKQIVHFELEEVDSFDINETERGEGGFGSTGIK